MKRYRLRNKFLNTKSDMNTNIRKNAAFFAKYICDDINASIRSSNFHNELKEAGIVLYIKRSQNYLKKIIDLLKSSKYLQGL